MCSLLQTQLFSLHTFHTYIFPIHVLCSFYLNQQYHLWSGTVVSGQIIMMRLKVMHPKRCGLFTERSVFGSRYKYDPQLALGVLSAVNKPRTRQSVVAQLWSFLLSPSFQTPSQRHRPGLSGWRCPWCWKNWCWWSYSTASQLTCIGGETVWKVWSEVHTLVSYSELYNISDIWSQVQLHTFIQFEYINVKVKVKVTMRSIWSSYQMHLLEMCPWLRRTARYWQHQY